MNTFRKSQAIVSMIAVLSSLLIGDPTVSAVNSTTPIVLFTPGPSRVTAGNDWTATFAVRKPSTWNITSPAIAEITFDIYAQAGTCENSVTVERNRIARIVGPDTQYTSVAELNPLTWHVPGNFPPPASVCYVFKAKDTGGTPLPYNGKIVGAIGIDAPFVVVNPGTGGTSGGSNAGSSSLVAFNTIPSSPINHSVNPSMLNLRNGAMSSSIEVIALETLTSLAIDVRDDGGNPVNRNFPFKSYVQRGEVYITSWNGSCGSMTTVMCTGNNPDGTARFNTSKVKSGRYFVKYFVSGNPAGTDSIDVENAVAPTPAPRPTTPPPSGGTSGGTQTPAPAPTVPASSKFGPITYQPTEFDPRSNDFLSNHVTFSVPVKQQVNSFSIVIKNFSGNVVNSNIYRGSLPLPARTNPPYSIIWDGTCRNSSVCADGAYVNPASYQFFINAENTPIMDGVLTVTQSSTIPNPNPNPNPQTGQFILGTPQVIPPSIMVGQSTTVYFTTGKQTTNLMVQVYDPLNSNRRKTLTLTPFVSSSTFPQNNYQAFWDGTLTDLSTNQTFSAPVGSYTYSISATGETAVSGPIIVTTATGTNPLALTETLTGPFPLFFNAANGESVNFFFEANQAAKVTARIFRTRDNNGNTQSTLIKTFLQPTNFQNNYFSGQTTFTWRGESDSQGRNLTSSDDNGTYTLFVDVQTDRGESRTEQRNVSLQNNGTSSSSVHITRYDPSCGGTSRNPFDPTTQNTCIRYSVNQDANMTITIRRAVDNSITRTLIDGQRRSANTTFEEVWSGGDQNGCITCVADGIYRYTIFAAAVNGSGSDSATGEVEVRRGITNVLTLDDFGPSRTIFNPYIGETTVIRYQVNRTDAITYVEILQGGATGSTLVSIPVTRVTGNNATYEATWNGKNSGGQIVANDTYAYRITASIGNTPDTRQQRTGYVRVNSTGSGSVITGTTTTVSGYCAGFSDVFVSDPICPAVQFAVNLGIFMGDSGQNTLRPNERLTRADAAAVTQRAFGYTLSPYNASQDGSMGFFDLRNFQGQWFMPNLKTYIIRNVLQGYPGKTMRPTNPMKRAELYRMFVEAALQAPRAITNFNIERNVTWKPFIDTPLNIRTRWYMPYANFATVYQLMTNTYYRPGEIITRGEVIWLIYNTSQKNLITYNRTR